MAVKNLRADAVKEVQVFDKKSEQAGIYRYRRRQNTEDDQPEMKEDRRKVISANRYCRRLAE